MIVSENNINSLYSEMCDTKPPHIETYYQEKENEHVYISNLSQLSEREENVRLAKFLAQETLENVYILPHIQPTGKEAERLRKEFFPIGVKQNKNPDYYFRGRFVDAKCLFYRNIKNERQTKRKIQNRIKYGFEQAQDVLLEIPTAFPMEWIRGAVEGKLNSSSNNHVVYVKYGERLLVYKTKNRPRG